MTTENHPFEQDQTQKPTEDQPQSPSLLDKIRRTAARAKNLKSKLSKLKKEDPNIYPLF